MMRRLVFLLSLSLLAVSACDEGYKIKKDYYEDGTLKSKLSYHEELLEGVSVWYYASGKPQMEVMYKDNKMNGLLRRWYENGNLMEESWYKGGVQDSISHTYALDGTLASEGYYVDGKLSGPYKRWYDNGQVFQDGSYVNDNMDGSWMIFYPDGNLAATANFDMGTGVQTSYAQAGYKCLVTPFVDNVKHGREIYYNPDGEVTRVAVYEEGEWIRDE
jgi:antitoxin component YwqK of YwqJK toxin-antitoxin module